MKLDRILKFPLLSASELSFPSPCSDNNKKEIPAHNNENLKDREKDKGDEKKEALDKMAAFLDETDSVCEMARNSLAGIQIKTSGVKIVKPVTYECAVYIIVIILIIMYTNWKIKYTTFKKFQQKIEK